MRNFLNRTFLNPKFVNRLVAGSVIFVLAVNPALAALQNPARLAAGVTQSNTIQNPIAVAAEPNQSAAVGVVLDANNHQTELKQSSNGTTVVDIAAPTAKGVSQNNFSEFNVDQNGIIFNNSKGPVLTQLGGWSDGNRRLAGGEAKIILTQVTGNNRSQLQGQVEIAGKAADFILANANGITCNGCGFINTPRVSLITGNANYAADGSLGFNILGGDVAIEGQGLNATNISRFDIISRAAKINAAIYADQLNVITGKNAVDYPSGSVNTLSDATHTTTPLFAIDSSLLGGMYGNNIRLIGTEKGLGVNTQGLVQSVGDLEITADGDIQLKTAQANQKVVIHSDSGSINNQSVVYGKEVSIFAKNDVNNQNLLAAEQQLNISATNFNQSGSVYAGLKADNTLTGQGNATINLSGAFNNSQDFFAAGSANLSIGQLNNNGAFVLQSEKNIAGIAAIKNTSTLQFNFQDSVSLVTNSLDNQNGVLSYSGAGTLNLNLVGDLNNTKGILSSNANLNLTANNIDNTSGVISAKQAQLQIASLNNSLGTLETSQLNLSGSNLNNQEGVITAINNLGTSQGSSINLSGDLNNNAGVIYFNNSQSNPSVQANVAANSIVNNSGLLVFANQMPANITSLLNLDNQLGLIQSGDLNLTATNLHNNSGQIIASTGALSVQSLSNDAGQLQADKWSINADRYSSAGGVIFATAATAGGISLNANQDINQSAGAVIKSQSGDVTLTANNIQNAQSAITVSGDGTLSLLATRLLNTDGAISSNSSAKIALTDFDNSSGYLGANGLVLNSISLKNTSGVIQNTGSFFNLTADSVDNRQGVISSKGTLYLTVKNNVDNQQGVVNSDGHLSVITSNLFNESGSIVSSTELSLVAQQQISNNLGQLIATNLLTSQSNQFNNGAGLISAKALNLSAEIIDVGASGSVQAEHLTLKAPQINNSGFIFSNGAASTDLTLETQLLRNSGTLEAASYDWDLSNLNLINDKGALVHDGQGELKLGSIASSIDFDNSNSVIATQGTLSLKAKSINNTYGTLIASRGLNLQLTDLNNQFGVLQSGGDFNLNTTSLNNANGSLVLDGDSLASVTVVNQLDNQQGTIVYSGTTGLTLNAADVLNNSGKIISQSNLTINNTGSLENNLGLLSAVKRFELNTDTQNNQGELSAGDLFLNVTNFNNGSGSLVANSVSGVVGKFNNQQGLLQSDLFDLNLQDFDNSNQGQVFSSANIPSLGKASKISAKNWNNNTGSLAVNQITLIGDSLSNQQGTMTADTINLQLKVIDNSSFGKIAAINSLNIQASTLNNQNGIVQTNSAGIQNVNSTNIDNTAGSIASLGAGTLAITADQLLQSSTSEVYAKNDLLISLVGNLDNKGSIQAENYLDLTANTLSNSLTTSKLLANRILINANDTNNLGHIEANQIQIDGTTATNAGVMIGTATAGPAMQFNLTGNLLNLGVLENNGSDWTLSRVSNQGIIQLIGNGQLNITDVENKITGKIYSNGDIKIAGDSFAGTFNNAGILSAVKNLDIAIANTNNQGGQLVAGGSFSLSGKTLNNQMGLIASQTNTNDGIQFNLSGLLDNSNNGQIESASTQWTLQNISLNNSNGTINHLGAGTLTINSVGDLSNNGGKIQSTGNLTVNALDSNASVINSEGLLRGKVVSVSASNSILNTGVNAAKFGEISGSSLNLTALTIDNTFGRLISNDPLNGNINFITPNLIKNISGVMSSSAKDWQLNLDQFDNTNGSIVHDGLGTLTLNSAKLLSNAGTISSIADVVVNSVGLDNSGNLIADKNLSLNSSGSIANQLSGRISVNGNLSINANNIAKIDFYNAGEINSLNQIDLNIGSGDAYNTGSLVFSSTSNPWKINSLTNSGYISHNGTGIFQLAGSSITNSGTLLSEFGSINFTAASITNNKDIIANQFNAFGVSIFKNTSGALLSSNQIQINNAQTIGGLFENDGTVEAAGVTNSLQVYTTQFSNLVNGEITTNSNNQAFYGDFTNAGIFTHAGAGNLELGKSGALITAANSEINSAGLIKVSNSISGPGKIYSSAGIDIDTGSQTFINSGATFYTTKNLSIYSGVDNQTNGQLVSDGAMVINTVGVVTNSGLIQGQSLQLTASSLTNNKEIFSVGGLSGQISVQSLTNAGTIGSSSAHFAISTTNGSLTNTSAGIINVESGLSLSAINNDINNQGLIQSNGSLTINKNANVTNQLINNGIIIGDTLDFNLNKIDNRFGTINATGSALSSLITTATTADAFNNINGKIFANSTNFTISSSGAFDNSSGQVNHYGNGTFTFSTQSINTDSSSKILSNGSIDLTVTSQLNNAGEISALNLNHIKANNLVNTGVIGSRLGEVKLDLANFSLTNTSGTINGFQKLTIDAQSIGNAASLESSNDIQITTNGFSQVGNINSNNLLSITLGKGDLNLTSSDSIKAPGSLSITLSELGRGFNNNGTISSVNAMTLTGSYLNNYAGARIDVGNGLGLLDITGDIYNEGIISAKQNLLINANNFINTSGAEVISGNDLAFSLASGNFTNHNIIFSAGNIDVLGAQNIFNNSRAEIRSLGNLSLSASDSIINTEARIESGGNMVLSAPNRIENNSTPAVLSFSPFSFQVDLNGFAYPDPYYDQVVLLNGPYIDEIDKGTVSNSSSIIAAKIFANGDLNLEGGSSAIVKNNEGEIFAGGNIVLNANTWVGLSTAEGFYSRRIELNGTAGWIICTPVGSTNCITTPAYYWRGTPIISTLISTSRLFGFTHANGNIITSLSNVTNDINFVTSSGSTRTPNDTDGLAASNKTGSSAGSKTENPVDVNGKPLNGGSTNAGNYNGATVTLAGLTAGIGANGKGGANASGTGANQQNGNATQGINYLSAIDANQLQALAKTDALNKLLAQLNGGNLTQQQLIDLINQIRSGQNPFTTDQELQNFLSNVNGWFDANLSESDKQTLLAQNDLNTASAKAKAQQGNTQAPTLIQVNILPYGFNLNNLSGLFVINNAPNARYLVETRPEFTQYTHFLGSDYLLAQLGLDPDKTQKRLGDAFYENQLVKDSLMRDFSLRYLDGALDDFSMMQILMDNAVHQNASLHLSMGVELTPEQCAHLTEDMLWLVEKTVKGQKVLVPHLYLTSVSKDKLEASTSALAAGGTLELTAKNGITNNSKIVANNLLMSTQGSLDQNGTLIAYGDIRLLADKNVRNIGKISGGSVGLLAKGDVTNQGSVKATDSIQMMSTQGTVKNLSSGEINSQGLLAISAKKDVTLGAGKIETNDLSLFSKDGDIIFEAPAAGKQTPPRPSPSKGEGENNLAGADSNLLPLLKGEAGRGLIVHNNLQADAGHNIELGANTIKTDNNILLHAANDINATDTLTHHAGTIESKNGVIQLDAGHDVNLQGTKIKTAGDISIAAKNDLNFDAIKHKQHDEVVSKNKKNIDDKITHTLVDIESTGGNIKLDAGNDANLTGVNINAKQNVIIHAERDTNISAVVDSDYHYDKTTKKSGGVLGVGGSKKTVINENQHDHVVGGEVSAGGDVLINAQISQDGKIGLLNSRDVNLTGVAIHSNGDAYVGAKNNINLTAIEEFNSDKHLENKKGAFNLSGSQSSRVSESTFQVGSVVSSNQDLVVLSGKDTNLQASGLIAKNDVDVRTGLIDQSGSLNLLSLQDSEFSKNKKSSKRFTLGLDSKSISFTKQKKSESDDTEYINAGSLIKADGNVTAHSANAIQLTGSKITAVGDIELIAKGDVNIESAAQSQSFGTEHSVKRDQLSLSSDRNGISVFAGNETKEHRQQVNAELSSESNIHADGEVKIKSDHDVNISGSVIDAKKSITLDAKNNINVLSSSDSIDSQVRDSKIRDGLTVTANHNIGQAADSIKNLGNLGNNGSAVSDASSVMKAVDSVNNVGASASAHLGRTSTRTISEVDSSHVRGSSITSGDNVIFTAGGDINVAGSKVKATRDIDMDATNINLIAVDNKDTNTNKYDYHQTGLTLQGGKGNVSLTAGFSEATSQKDDVSITKTGTQIDAKNIKLHAKNDINIEGSDLNASKDADLFAGNNLNVLSSKGYTTSTLDESHKSAGGGVNFGTQGIGVTAYVAMGENNLDRNNISNRNSTLDVKGKLTTHSGNDTTIAGANIKAADIDMDVGHDLLVASVQDTGNVKGRKWDASLSVTAGAGFSMGVSAGYGETSGSKAWVSDQTQVIGTHSVKIKVGNHMQLNGAEIANVKEDGTDGGNLNLTTKTFGFTDLKDHDKEKSSYLSIGFSTGGSSSANKETGANPNKSSSSYSLSGNYSNTNQEQITHATLGNGTIHILDDEKNNSNSLSGLNRDITQAQDITKKDETKVNLYVSTSSIEVLKNPKHLAQSIEPGRMLGRVAGEFLVVADNIDNAAVDTKNGGRSKDPNELNNRGFIKTSDAITLQGKVEDYGLAAQQGLVNINHDGHFELFGHALVGENGSDGGHGSVDGLGNSFSDNFTRNQQARNHVADTRDHLSNTDAGKSPRGNAQRDGVDAVNNATDYSVEDNQKYASTLVSSITGKNTNAILYTDSVDSNVAGQANAAAVSDSQTGLKLAAVNVSRTDISNVNDYVSGLSEEARHLSQPSDHYANQYANQFAYLWDEKNIAENRSTGGELHLSGQQWLDQNKNNSTLKNNDQFMGQQSLINVEFRGLHSIEQDLILKTAHAYAIDNGISDKQAVTDLTSRALARVDTRFENNPKNDKADKWLDTMSVALLKDPKNGAYDIRLFSATDEQKSDHNLLAGQTPTINSQQTLSDNYTTRFILKDVQSLDAEKTYTNLEAFTRTQVGAVAYVNNQYGRNEIVYGKTYDVFGFTFTREFEPSSSWGEDSLLTKANSFGRDGIVDSKDLSGLDKSPWNPRSPFVDAKVTDDLRGYADYLGLDSSKVTDWMGGLAHGTQRPVLDAAIHYQTNGASSPVLLVDDNVNNYANRVQDVYRVVGKHFDSDTLKNIETVVSNNPQGNILDLSVLRAVGEHNTYEANSTFITGPKNDYNNYLKQHPVASQFIPGFTVSGLVVNMLEGVTRDIKTTFTDYNASPSDIYKHAAFGTGVDVVTFWAPVAEVSRMGVRRITSLGAENQLTSRFTASGEFDFYQSAHAAEAGVIEKGSELTPPQIRQQQMLDDNKGFNISPLDWDKYPTIGRNGTFVTDEAGITKYFGDLTGLSETTITKSHATTIEIGSGLELGSLQDGIKIRQVNNLQDMAPRSPMEGNDYFLGPGKHLPNGSPEMVIDSIPTVDTKNVNTILNVKVVDDAKTIGADAEKSLSFAEDLSGEHNLSPIPNPKATQLLINSDVKFSQRVADIQCVDCDDLARALYTTSGENGKILDLTVPKGEIKVPEFEKIESFVDHRIYTDGNFVFDPRFSNKPIPIDEYFKTLKDLNPDLTVKDITPK